MAGFNKDLALVRSSVADLDSATMLKRLSPLLALFFSATHVAVVCDIGCSTVDSTTCFVSYDVAQTCLTGIEELDGWQDQKVDVISAFLENFGFGALYIALDLLIISR
jgi:hypothetical protein